VQVPADCGVTVKVTLGPFADAGATVAIVPPAGEQVSVSASAPLSPASLAMNVCPNWAPVLVKVSAFGFTVSGAGVGLGVGDGVGVGVGEGVGDGVGVGEGVGDGVGDGLGVAVGESVGAGVADPDALGRGDALGDGLTLAVGDGDGDAEPVGLETGKRSTFPLPPEPLQLDSANASNPIAEKATELNERYRPIRFTSDLISSQGHRKYTARRALCHAGNGGLPSPLEPTGCAGAPPCGGNPTFAVERSAFGG